MLNYFDKMFSDPLYMRIVLVIWGSPFFALFVYLLASVSEIEGELPFLIFVGVMILGIGAIGAYFLYVGFFGADKTVNKAVEYIQDGGNLSIFMFVIAIGIFAIPIWELLRHLR